MAELSFFRTRKTLHEGRCGSLEAGNRVTVTCARANCLIHDGQIGFCLFASIEAGKLYSLGYGSPAALQVIPSRKSP